MTRNDVPVDDRAALHRILADAAALLLDFDGPVCSVFAGFPAPVVAEQLREVLAEGGHCQLPPEVQRSDDPFEVLDFAAIIGGDEARYVEAALRAHEVEAVATAAPTPGAHDLIRAWKAGNRFLAVVSNNSTSAVETYLHLNDLGRYVDVISARAASNPELLKPNPHLVNLATEGLGVAPEGCVLIGDSVTDVQAAHAAGVPVIGFANKQGKVDLLANEHPQAITTSMESIAGIMRSG